MKLRRRFITAQTSETSHYTYLTFTTTSNNSSNDSVNMVLADLGKRITGAVSGLVRSDVVDDKVRLRRISLLDHDIFLSSGGIVLTKALL